MQVIRFWLKLIAGLFVIAAAQACAGDPAPDGATLYTYRDPGGNTFSCATCHALSEPASDGFRRVGHPLGDATKRPSYKNGQLTDMLEAVNSCRQEWMATEPWREDSREWQALFEFLDAQATVASAVPLNYNILSAAPPDLSGSVADGQSVFNQTCASCHGQNAIGADVAPPLLGELLLAQGAATLVTERVRTSGLAASDVYPGLTGGRMPFWSAERLSDQELADVIAFVLVNNPEPDLPDSDGEANAIAGLDRPGNCASTHEKVGYTTTLSEKAHGVSGKATIYNDCTIRLHDFNYDGNGIDVRVYGGIAGDYHNGFPMSPDLLRDGGYQNATLYIQVPAGKSLDDFDGVSIWCVDAAVDFGSGIFGPP